MLRPSSALAFMVTVSCASASYEMMLAATADGRIHRYDIENNVYLGSFGNFQVPFAESVVARTITGHAFVEYNNRIHRFNYHTGEYQGSIGLGFFDVKHMSLMNDGRLLVTHSTGSHAVDPVTGTVGAGLAYVSNDVPMGAVQLASGKFMALSRFTVGSTNTYYSNRMSSTGTLESSISFAAVTGTTDQYIGVGKVGDRVLYWGDDGAALFNGFGKVATEGNVVSSISTSTTEAPIFGTTSGMTHTGTLVTIGSTVSGVNWSNRLYYASSAVGYGMGYTTTVLPITTQVKSVDVVLAPEPGTMAALAGGIAILLRKRRAKR